MTNPRFVNIHILQAMPFSNLNRDDMGAPKDLSYGGTRRVRVSSQCYKRSTRKELQAGAPDMDFGERSRQHGRVIAEELTNKHDWPELTARIAAQDMIKPLGEKEKGGASEGSQDKDTSTKRAKKGKADNTDPIAAMDTSVLLYLNKSDLDRFIALAQANREIYQKAADQATDTEQTPRVQRSKSEKNKWERTLLHVLKEHTGAGLALFGRMIAALPEGRIDGASQVAHAFTTHTAKLEVDYFTAVDDIATGKASAGSGHLDTAEYAGGVFYRYATLDIEELAESLTAAADVARLAGMFVQAFALAVPSGKRTSTAPHTLPALAYVSLRSDRPVNLAAAFETPVEKRTDANGNRTSASGYLPGSLEALGEHLVCMDGFLGTGGRVWHAHAATTPKELVNKGTGTVEGFGERMPLPDLLSALEGKLGARR
ncbi:type I-E CRISPR-associated protein Cas7/Cse4/CasC [Nocardiopsis sp. NPDC049922]|uniref:type I-E CRISPR-associated protein Cas7/Cse4/CasC n=1 Tax=Nocardiopsis sp. NPDC049922 TaxID=3155157 RepID=UPI0033DE7744